MNAGTANAKNMPAIGHEDDVPPAIVPLMLKKALRLVVNMDRTAYNAMSRMIFIAIERREQAGSSPSEDITTLETSSSSGIKKVDASSTPRIRYDSTKNGIASATAIADMIAAAAILPVAICAEVSAVVNSSPRLALLVSIAVLMDVKSGISPHVTKGRLA